MTEKNQLLFENIAINISVAQHFIKLSHIGNCYKADPKYGEDIVNALGISIDEIKNIPE